MLSAPNTDAPVASGPLAARYESLIRLAEAIRSQRDRGDLFDLLANELRSVVQFDAILQYDEAANKVRWLLCEGCSEPTKNPLSGIDKEQTLAWWIHANQQVVVIPQLDREPRFTVTLDRLRARGIQSLCAFPLSTSHRRLGSLVIASRNPDAYSPEEVRFITLLVDQIALAIDDAVNFQSATRAADRLRLLLDLTNRVTSTLDLRELLREAASSIRRVMHCEGVGVTLPDADTGTLRLYALDFPEGKGILHEGIVVTGISPTVERVFASGKPLALTEEEIEADGVVAAEGARSICRFPLVGRDRILGVLSMGSRSPNAFSADDFAFMEQVAGQIAIAVENALAYQQIADLKDTLAREKVYLEDEIRTELNFEEIVGTSRGLRRVLRQVETVAPTDSTVLIHGETGTGKELIARALHNLSARRRSAFVKLNCAAIPTGLLESELFGHEKGAFTGAIAQRIGRFELAHRGTIFLDEVSEIPLELQPKLLRVLQEQEFERLGSTRTIRTDARLIAATNRDLDAMVQAQQFRADLFYRLNVFPIRVPPLRDRPDDIPLLVRHFVQQFSRRNNRSIDTIPSETMEALVRYHWPGNIRELQNVIERAVIISTGPVLKVPIAELKPPRQPKTSVKPAATSLKGTLGDAERAEILKALEEADWIVAGANGAAARLGMKRSTLQFRMRKLGIQVTRTGSTSK